MSDAPGGIYALESAYLERAVQVGIASGTVIRVTFPASPDEDAEREHALLDRIEAYLEGVEEDFSGVDVGLTIPTDQRSVLEVVQGIPYGEQVSVDQVGRMAALDADEEERERTVRTALAENPVPLIIADHRVRDGPSGAPPEVEQRLRSIEGL